MAGVSIKIEGKEEALAKIKAATDVLEHPRALFDLIGAALVTSTRERFQDGAGPDGNPWPPSFRALMGGGKTLLDTGRLANSLTHEATDTSVAVGTNVLYAAIHQFGGTIRAKNAEALHFKVGGKDIFVDHVTMPARPFLGLDRDDEALISSIVEAHFAKVMGEPVK